jgi:hypothetical protein
LNGAHQLNKFTYLGMTVTHQNYIHEGNKSRLNSENSSYNSFQNSLSASVKKMIILPVVLYVCETWCLTLRKTQIEDVQEQGAEENIWMK